MQGERNVCCRNKHTEQEDAVLSTVMSQASQVAPTQDVRNWGSVRVSEKIPWRRGMVNPLQGYFLKSHGQKSLVGCSPWGHRESDLRLQSDLARTWLTRVALDPVPSGVGGWTVPFLPGRAEGGSERTVPPASIAVTLLPSPLQRHDDPSQLLLLFLCEAQSRSGVSPATSC